MALDGLWLAPKLAWAVSGPVTAWLNGRDADAAGCAGSICGAESSFTTRARVLLVMKAWLRRRSLQVGRRECIALGAFGCPRRRWW